MKASVITLGCKVNEYESQSMMRQLKEVGYEISEGLVFADLYIVNTCAVTNTGEKKSRQVLSKILKINKDAKIIVCGCAVQNNPSSFLVHENVVALTGNYGKHNILQYINEGNKTLPDLEHKKYLDMARPLQTKTRQYIKCSNAPSSNRTKSANSKNVARSASGKVVEKARFEIVYSELNAPLRQTAKDQRSSERNIPFLGNALAR